MARQIRVELDLDTGNFTAKVQDATGKFIDFDEALKKAGGSMDVTAQKSRNLLKSVRDLTIVLSQARSALFNVRAVLLGWLGPIIAVNREIERASFLLQGLSTALTEAGRRTEAADNLSRLLEMAKTSPFALNALTDSFVKMKSTGMDPLNGSMKSLLDAVARFGGDSNILHRASIAIQQMSGKGVISMEELRQQLGEAVPNAVRLMARSMGLTYRELVDKISKGQVEAQSALRKMFGEFERTFGGSSARLVDSFNGSMSRAKTALMEFALAAGRFNNGQYGANSFMLELKDGVESFIALLNTPNGKATADRLGEGIRVLVANLKDMAVWVTKNVDLVLYLGKILVIALGSQIAVRTLVALISNMGIFNRSVRTGIRSLGTLFSSLGSASAAFFGLSSASAVAGGNMSRAGAALKLFGRSLQSAIPILGIIIGVIAAAAEQFGWFESKAQKAKGAWEEFARGIVSTDALKKAAADVEQLQDKIGRFKAFMNGNGKGVQAFDGKKFSRSFLGGSAANDYLKTLERQLAEKRKNITTALSQYNNDEGESQGQAYIRAFERDMGDLTAGFEKVSSEYEERLTEIEKNTGLSAAGRKDAEEAARAVQIANIEAYYAELLKMAEASGSQLALERKAWDEVVTQGMSDTFVQDIANEKSRADKKIQVWEAYFLELKKRAREGVKNALDPNVFFAGTENGNKSTANPILRKIATLSGDIAKLKNAYDEAKGAVEEFNAEVEEGMYAKSTEAQRERVRLLIAEKAALENLAKAEEHLAKIMEEVGRANDDANVAIQSMLGAGGLQNADVKIENFRQRLEKMLFAMRTATGETDQYRAAVAAVAKAVEDFGRGSQADAIQELIDKTRELKDAEMTVEEARAANYAREVARIERMINAEKFHGEERIRVNAIVHDYLQALRNSETNEVDNSLRRQLSSWKHMNDNIKQWTVETMDKFIDALAEGELKLADFVSEVLKEIFKIIVRAYLADAILSSIGLGSGGKSSGPPSPSYVPAFSGATTSAPRLHTGGTVGLNTKGMKGVMTSAFSNAMRYHNGGIAGLKPNETAAILENGERVLTQAEYRAMNRRGGGQAPNVSVNVINQSGVALDASDQKTKFDGQRMIVDVVVAAMNRPGKMRDSMQRLT